MRGRREDMQPSHENCIIPGEADRVAAVKNLQSGHIRIHYLYTRNDSKMTDNTLKFVIVDSLNQFRTLWIVLYHLTIDKEALRRNAKPHGNLYCCSPGTALQQSNRAVVFMTLYQMRIRDLRVPLRHS